MVNATCIEKVRNKQGKILGYKILDLKSKQVLALKPYVLKDIIRNK